MYFGAAAIILLVRGLFWLVLLLGVVFLAVAAWRSWSTPLAPVSPRGTGEGALAILAARYARGEISREEYLQVRRDLTGTPGGEG